MTTMYAAVKWPVKEGPNPRDLTNDLEILAATLIAEWDWSFEAVEDAFGRAVDAAQEQAMAQDENSQEGQR